MDNARRDPESGTSFDVVICGGGLAGLLLARQLRRELPELSVAVLERTTRPLPEACHKVGESSVELGSQYLERLGLRDYLLERHIVKLGLRFFPGGGDLPLIERTEIGPCAEPLVRSYQLDRGRFEEDLRGFAEEDGARIVEGARVRDVEFGEGDAPHVISFDLDGEPRRLRARWVVDATGRVAILRRKMKLTRGSRHAANAAWFRISGRLDINDLVPASEQSWRARPCGEERWRSTNHLMGAGYWVWIIPLSSGNTSIGVVVHDEMHEFHSISSLERAREFIARHEPVMVRALEQAEVLDFLCLKGYSHAVSRAWSADRWAIVGEAGAFVDPLYSPGTDFIAFANCFTTEMLRTERARGDLQAKASQLNTQYRALVTGAIDIFRQAAPVYGHARAMSAKVYWDNFAYWSFTCHYYQQGIYQLGAEEHEPFTEVGRRFIELTSRMQTFFKGWAEVAPSPEEATFRPLPVFPSVLVDAHLAVATRMTVDETLEYMRMRARQGEEIVGEIVLRVIQELGPELGQKLLESVGFDGWNISISPERLDLEACDSLTRRQRLSDIARDVERSLGRVYRHPEAGRARERLAQGSAA